MTLVKRLIIKEPTFNLHLIPEIEINDLQIEINTFFRNKNGVTFHVTRARKKEKLFQ